jgi:DNA-binding NtrC family response regulator
MVEGFFFCGIVRFRKLVEPMSNILVIDDEAVLLDLIATVLRLDGHTVIAMSDPLAALDCLRGAELLPIDLLLTDIEMKPISGFELVNCLGKTGIIIPVLFTSGYPALSGAVANSLGERSILEKPYTAAQLRTAVSKALRSSKAKPPAPPRPNDPSSLNLAASDRAGAIMGALDGPEYPVNSACERRGFRNAQ